MAEKEPEQLQDPTPDVMPPELDFADHWEPTEADPDRMPGPEITIRTPEGGGEGKEPDHTVYIEAFAVSTGDLVNAVIEGLKIVGPRVDFYTTFRNEVLKDESWIFAVSSEADVGGDGNPYNGGKRIEHTQGESDQGVPPWSEDEVDDYYGATPAQVTQLNTYQHQLLAAGAT